MTKLLRLGLALAAALVFPARTFAQADVVEYYHLDALGNVMAVSNAAGVEIESHDYLPFGEEWCGTSVCGSVKAGQLKRFTGKERDAETGLDYFGARYYRANVGRFTTIDPLFTWQENLVDPQRWNRYAYVRNNPLRYIDPDGRELKIAIYNSSLLPGHITLAAAAKTAQHFRDAGVLNVTTEVRGQAASSLLEIAYELGPNRHSELVQLLPDGSRLPTDRVAQNVGSSGHTKINAKWVSEHSGSEAELIQALSNLMTHEIRHTTLFGHGETAFGRGGTFADSKWRMDPGHRFSAKEATALRERYNKPGEVEKKQ